MRKEYYFKSYQSGKAYIIIDDDKIIIKRKGLLALGSHGMVGEKTIRISQISAVQLKEAGLTIGYIQFILKGSQESKGGLHAAMDDENTVCFDGGLHPDQANSDARAIRKYIEEYFKKLENDNKTVVNQDDKYDQLFKLKKLLDEGIITQEEFNAEKIKLLN